MKTLLEILLSAQFTYPALILTGLGAGYLIRRVMAERGVRAAEVRSRTILQTAQTQAQSQRRQAETEVKELKETMRQNFHKETETRRNEMAALERKLTQHEANLDRKVDLLEEKERRLQSATQALTAQQDQVAQRQKELDSLVLDEKSRLQKVAGLSKEEAKDLYLRRLEQDLSEEAGALVRKKEEEARLTAAQRAKEIVTRAIQRCSVDCTTEATVSVITLPNEEMKGRIIGREGRNIRALEMATGVDVIVDDTPGTVTLSGFDPIRREVARRAMERLIEDGRIHPSRIEEAVSKVKHEMEIGFRETGEETAVELEVPNLHPELVKLLGKLKYRTSFGQNALQHCKEVSMLTGHLAAQCGEDPKVARRAGLLHDVAKSASDEMDGPQAHVGMELLEKYGESEEVIHAVEAHHEDVEAHSALAVLVQAADAISSARPGARRDSLENYVQRLEKLEKLARGFPGVEQVFAIQAGREIRIMVHPDKINDLQAIALAREIRKKIETLMQYPGQIKVTVIRELRAVDYAK